MSTQPFFTRFLDDQDLESVNGGCDTPAQKQEPVIVDDDNMVTLVWPSDGDHGSIEIVNL